MIKYKCVREKPRKTQRKKVYSKIYLEKGRVPCFVCGNHVKWLEATLEHIVPISLNGTDDDDNLSISHFDCNVRKGNKMPPAMRRRT